MNESDLCHYILPYLRQYGDFRRVENTAETGTPDINYALNDGPQGWIEVKVLKAGWMYFERFQLPWLNRRLKVTNGQHVWVLVGYEENLGLLPAAQVLQAPREPSRKWVRVRLIDVPGPSWFWERPCSWTEVVQVLAEPQTFTVPLKEG